MSYQRTSVGDHEFDVLMIGIIKQLLRAYTVSRYQRTSTSSLNKRTSNSRRPMNCTGQSEATFRIGKKVVDCCEIDLWHTLWSPALEGGDVLDWSLEMVEELAIASGMAGGRIIPPGEEQDPECYGSVGEARAFDIFCQVGADSPEFINDLEVEGALNLWREQDNMDDISDPSYFTQWDQSLNAATWVSDPRFNAEPLLLTPEMLQQTDKLNILWDEEAHRWDKLPDQLATLEVLAIGDKHGVAKCAYGGVFLTKGSLTYLQRVGDVKIGDKFKCWITFTNAKYPWRTVVNGVVN